MKEEGEEEEGEGVQRQEKRRQRKKLRSRGKGQSLLQKTLKKKRTKKGNEIQKMKLKTSWMEK